MINVLIIEDKYSIAKTLHDFIKENYENSIDRIEIVEEATEAMYELENNHYHLIFWDIDLNGTDSYGLIKYFPPVNSYLLIFSENENVYDYLIKFENLTRSGLDIDAYNKKYKRDLNKIAEENEMHEIVKTKIGKDNSKALNVHIKNAISKYGSIGIELIDANKEKGNIRLYEIVMITTIDNNKFKFNDTVFLKKDKPLGFRKAIFRKKDFIITMEINELKTLENVIENLLKNDTHFLRLNSSTIINMMHIAKATVSTITNALTIEMSLQINNKFNFKEITVEFETKHSIITLHPDKYTTNNVKTVNPYYNNAIVSIEAFNPLLLLKE